MLSNFVNFEKNKNIFDTSIVEIRLSLLQWLNIYFENSILTQKFDRNTIGQKSRNLFTQCLNKKSKNLSLCIVC